jgi:hypothetical protein
MPGGRLIEAGNFVDQIPLRNKLQAVSVRRGSHNASGTDALQLKRLKISLWLLSVAGQQAACSGQ